VGTGSHPLDGIRVVEVASWLFVPAASAILAEWGAGVIKVEHPASGDPIRGLSADGVDISDDHLNYGLVQAGRGKRSVGVDLASPAGREILLRLLDDADVFLTNYRAPVRRRLGIDIRDAHQRNPRIVYGIGSGHGPDGPDRDAPGMDTATLWARTGMAELYRQAARAEYPFRGVPGFGDLAGALALAGGVCAALASRRDGQIGTVVDASLLGSGAWMMALELIAARRGERPVSATSLGDRRGVPNPLANFYQTLDKRFICFQMLDSDRYWAEVCRRLDRPSLATDPRFSNATQRSRNRGACVDELDSAIGQFDLAHWRKQLQGLSGAWSVVQTPAEACTDEQVESAGYLRELSGPAGQLVPVLSTPVRFAGTAPPAARVPEHGEHTEELLLEIGYSWAEIAALKDAGVVT
jgi:crotonobetainyl-CoA:carnitine CoA-transferase CaiB-like acyl-CoA transferase